MLAGIVWFVVTWRDPNLRFSFIDDDAMRVRSAVFISVALAMCATFVRWLQFARGSRPIGVVRAVGAGVEVTQCSYSWWGRRRKRMLVGPITMRLSEDRHARVLPSMYLRSLQFRGGGGAFAINSLWDFDEKSIAELRSRLSALDAGSES